jgi:hypothetical protein
VKSEPIQRSPDIPPDIIGTILFIGVVAITQLVWAWSILGPRDFARVQAKKWPAELELERAK